MEQVIHTFGLDYKLLLIQTVNFLLLLLILKRFLYKPLLQFISDRQKTVAKGVEDALLAEKTLKEAKDRAERTTNESMREAEKISAESRRLAEEKKEATLKEANKRAQEIAEEAAREAVEIKNKAMRESEEEITKLSLLAAEKILRTQK